MNHGANYAAVPVADQFAVVTTEVGRHLPRVQEAARMWRVVAHQLAEVSESLGRELESVAPHWQDATGTGLLAKGRQRKEACDAALARIIEHQPWHALDHLARQLLLTEARMAGATERAALPAMFAPTHVCGMTGAACSCPAGNTSEDTGAHLAELDRYFQAAADSVLRSAGLFSPQDSVTDPASGNAGGSPSPAMGPALAGAPGSGLGPGGPAGGSLPLGAVSLPGLVAVPPGAGMLGGRPGSGTGGRSGRGLGPAGAFDSSTPPGAGSGGVGDSSVPPGAGGAGGLGGAPGGPDADLGGPEQIERAANPPEDNGPTPAPEPPAAPDRGDASSSSSGGGGGMGRFFPPMMFPPMMGMGAGGGGSRVGGGARTVGGNDRPTKARPNPTPGVPARLRGRSGLADPATNGFRPPTSAGINAGTTGQVAPEPLEHEMWEVAKPTSASPLKADAPEAEPTAKRRRAL